MRENVEEQRIPVKVYRTDRWLTVAAPMPGLEPEDIAVEVTQDNKLVLRGQLRGALKGLKDKDLMTDEWSVGDYSRELTLPASVDGETANVTYGNGVLVVALPLASRTRPARLSLASTGIAHGVHYGHAGHETADLTSGGQIPPQLNPTVPGASDAHSTA